jgi:uncharacterized protein with NRDE domain
MCLLAFAYRQHSDYELIVAGNRDESYDRASAPAAFWQDAPQVLAGRDLEKGGTWMGVTNTGRFAALTNFRDPAQRDPNAPSRGLIVSGFLTRSEAAADYLAQLAPQSARYNDFNLFLHDASGLFYFSSRSRQTLKLDPGIYAISNALLDEPWPKVVLAKSKLAAIVAHRAIEADAVLKILSDRSQPPDAQLPDTGVGREWERVLGSAFIVAPNYGTRASTAILMRRDGHIDVIERSYAREGEHLGTQRFAVDPT